MLNRLREYGKRQVFRHSRFGAPTYEYQIEPIQLMEIISGIERGVSGKRGGSLVEIGVARGMTSRFICEHVRSQGYNFEFYCLDTFSSFTENDIQFEVEKRGKKESELFGFFSYNDYRAWKRNFAEFEFVRPIQCDASQFDFSAINPIHFCFLDVDLYLPTKNVLNHIVEHMSKSSVIVVDDVRDGNRWDGAYQAFMEFVADRNLSHKIVGNKCGVIYL